MPARLAAIKALNEANKLMGIAKTDGERALAAARVLSAEAELAKVKKTKTVTTDTHEEEVDDGEPEDEETDDEDAEGDDDGEEASDDEPEEKATRPSGSRGGSTGSTSAIVALARKLTGKTSADEVMGALQAMADTHRKTSKLAAQVAALQADAAATKMGALIAKGLKAGKLAPSQRAWAATQTPASLKAYLDAAPKMVHSTDEEHTEAAVNGGAPGVVTAEMAKIWRKQGFAEKDFPRLIEKLNGAKSGANGVS